MLEGPAELSRFLFACEFFSRRPGRLWIDLEDRVAVVIELERDAVLGQHLPKEEKVALGVLVLAKAGRNNGASRVVDSTQESSAVAIGTEPVVVATVELEKNPFLGPPLAARAVARLAPAASGLEALFPANSSDARTAEDDAIPQSEKLGKMAVVAAA